MISNRDGLVKSQDLRWICKKLHIRGALMPLGIKIKLFQLTRVR